MSVDPSLMQDFLAESQELIDQFDGDLVKLESVDKSEQQDILNSCFRALHTIKGAASFLGLDTVITHAHAAEDALNVLRKGEVELTTEIMDVLLQSADIVRSQIESLAAGEEAEEAPQSLIDELHKVAAGEGSDAGAAGVETAVTESATEAETAVPEGQRKVELPPSKADLLEFMVQDLVESCESIDGLVKELESDATRGEAAASLTEAAEAIGRTADFFELEELTSLITALQETSSRIGDLPSEVFSEINVRLLALKALIVEQGELLNTGYVKCYDLTTFKQRLNTVIDGESLPEDIAGKHDNDVAALLTLDEIATVPEAEAAQAATTPASQADETASESKKAEASDDATKAKSAKPNAPVAEQTIRVEVSRLESLLNLVGQLVLNKNRVMALTRSLRDENLPQETVDDFNGAASDLDQLMSELQMGVMRTRMQPLAKLFDRYPRVIRDVARATEKKIDLIIEGKDTEVDKSVLESLADPLVHILRNSADHGVELPADRVAGGKPETGTIRLDAQHQGSHVRVAIVDDGKGLDREVIGSKAIEKGLTTPEQLAQLSDEDVFRFIFEAGFSTAKQVSDLSGRGVGMDVVRTNIQKINGEITISSKKGEGTTIEIMIPLTVAIMPAMVVGVGDHLYSIPLQSIEEIVKPDECEIYTVAGQPVMRLRDSVLPLLNMQRLLDENELEDGGKFAVVISVGAQRIGLIVDGLVGQQEIVIKPLDDDYTKGGPFSGATIREDGEVSLILDVVALMRQATQPAATIAAGASGQASQKPSPKLAA